MYKAKITIAIVAVLILSGFTYLAFNSGVLAKNLQLKTIKLESTETKLKGVNIQYEKLNTQLKTQTSTDKANIDNLKSQQEQLRKEKADLEAKLQAKADTKARLDLAVANAANTVTSTQTASAMAVPTYSGSHQDWMARAGISPGDYSAVDYIVSHESGWNPGAVNRSSGACGLGQQLPCGKWAGAWDDPIAALVAMNGYAIGRYGSWGGAYNHWVNSHWW